VRVANGDGIVVSHEEYSYQRFLYVSNLRAKVPLDHVIFVDDDQVWPDGFFLELLLSYAPKTSTHWYGKVYQPQSTPVNYWESAISMAEIVDRSHPEVTRFQYGGPGGAIYPADLWLVEDLLRLSGDLERFFKYEDIWVSYVMGWLLGWKMLRFNGPLPVDVGLSKIPNNITNSIRAVAIHGDFDEQGVLKYSQDKVLFLNELQAEPFNWNLGSQ